MAPTFPPHGKMALLLLLGLLSGCAGLNPADLGQLIDFGETPPLEFGEPPAPPVASVQPHGFYLSGENSVVGRLASVPVREGDTLPDIARHFGVGYQHIAEANPDVDLWAPRQGERAILPLQFILPDAPRKGVVVNLAALRLFYYPAGGPAKLLTWPLGIGKEGRATPLGAMTVERKAKNPTWYVPESIRKTHAQQGDPLPAVVPPGPDNPLGDYALYLSKPSYLIHGTNKPYSIGLRASNGCLRLYPEDIQRAFQAIPLKTPVVVVNQPYLLGWLDGGLYLEAHQPFEEIDPRQAKDNLVAKLKQIAKQKQRQLDWPKIEQTLKQARGIPVPIFAHTESLAARLAGATLLEHPEHLTGQPGPELPKGSWLLKTKESEDGFMPQRLAAQLNHLGPRIPARVIVSGGRTNRRHRVVVGPFADEKAARKAQAVLSEDFGTASELVRLARLRGAGWK